MSAWWNSETKRYPAAIVSGIALALSFPSPGWAGLAWLSPGLLFFTALGLPPKAAFRIGLVAGLAHFLVLLRWLLWIPFPAGAIAAWLALSGYCALFFGAWGLGMSWLASRLPRLESSASLVPGPPSLITLWGGWIAKLPSASANPEWLRRPAANLRPGWLADIAGYSAIPWTGRTGLAVTAAALWTALEWLRGWFLSGFPWCFVGISQWKQLPLLQVASITGVYGLSFLVCWCSLALAGALVVLLASPQRRWGWMSEARLPLLAILFLCAWGFWRVIGLRQADASRTERVSIALIQPAVPQTLLWDEEHSAEHFTKLQGLSEQALAVRPDILVWPEGGFGLNGSNYATMTNLIDRAGTAWIFNHLDEAEEDGRSRVYNANFLVSKRGRLESIYRKRRLVIFGEYVPFEKWLPFLHWLTPIGASFTPGEGAVFFEFPDLGTEASPLICFENVFPDGIRSHVRATTDFLLELTNDGWFGEGSEQWQHAAHSAFRAVENGVALVRCTNNGLTCWFDRAGILHDLFVGAGASVYSEGWEAIALPRGGGATPTFYHRHGNWFAWSCCVFASWGFLRARLSPKIRATESGAELS